MQVLDDVRLLGSVEEGHGTGVALLGPHAGVSRVYGHRSHMAEKVHHEGHRCDLDRDLRKKKTIQLEEQTTIKSGRSRQSAHTEHRFVCSRFPMSPELMAERRLSVRHVTEVTNDDASRCS